MREAFEFLTSVQRQCLHLRAEDMSYREIADVMDMSVWGVADAVRIGATLKPTSREGAGTQLTLLVPGSVVFQKVRERALLLTRLNISR